MRSGIIKDITRIVVKLGTGVLTDSRKQPDLAQMEQLVAQVAEQRQAGREIVLVSSGAVGAGMGALGYEKRPTIWRSCRLARRWANRGSWRFMRSCSARTGWPSPKSCSRTMTSSITSAISMPATRW